MEKWMEIYYEVQEENCYSHVYEKSPACSFMPSGKYCGKSLDLSERFLMHHVTPAMWPHRPGFSWLGQGWMPDPKIKGYVMAWYKGFAHKGDH